MLPLGDPHNFGQRVHRIERGSGTYFQKPRSVFWEWLFFGNTSPLREIVTAGLSDSDELAEALDGLFRLRVSSEDPRRGGESSLVNAAVGPAAPTSGQFLRFGCLLAYAFALGIRDLHRGNLVLTESSVQVVDAEVVLAKLALPNETLLLPLKDVPLERSGIGLLLGNRNFLDPDCWKTFCRGFVGTLVQMEAQSPQLSQALLRAVDAHPRVPVRHIVRDTKVYQEALEAAPPSDWMPSEHEQLRRGDIPYFFKLVGEPGLHVYTTRAGQYSRVDVPIHLESAVEREAVSPEALLASGRIPELLTVGSLYLARTLLPATFEGVVDLSAGYRVLVGASHITFETPTRAYQSARFRAVTLTV